MKNSAARCCWTLLFFALLLVAFGGASQAAPVTGVQYFVPVQGAQGPVTTALATTNSFRRFLRYPTETETWTTMTNGTAYFRDKFVAGETSISGAVDGDTWTALATNPSGGQLTWITMRFYAVYGSNQNCFVSSSPGSPIFCDTTSLTVDWYFDSQCAETGQWTMSFLFRGTSFASASFTILPQVPPDALPPMFDQRSATYINEKYDHVCVNDYGLFKLRLPCFPPFDKPYCVPSWSNPFQQICSTGVALTIGTEGCYLMAATMLFNYHGVAAEPLALNDWLGVRENEGYSTGGSLRYQAIPTYAQANGVNMTFEKHIAPDAPDKDAQLENAICQFGPQIVALWLDIYPDDPDNDPAGHRVLVTGRNVDTGAWLVMDPWEGYIGDWDTARHGDDFIDSWVFKGPDKTFTHQNGVEISFHSPGEVLLTSPSGLRTGYDPIAGIAYDEIPGAAYERDTIGSVDPAIPADETKVLLVPAAEVGDYSLRVVGTGLGYYSLNITTQDPTLNSGSFDMTGLPISPGEVHDYTFNNQDAAAGPELAGAFDGKGQRPVDVNRFLTYINPTQVTTTVPAASPVAKLMVVYGNSITPATFTADLNGIDVASSFNPTPGTTQRVVLALQPGRNVLKLSVSGQNGSHSGTDTDRLVFVVQ